MVQTPVRSADPTLGDVLQSHVAALKALHLREPRTQETIGQIEGLGALGSFHEWHDGDRERRDDILGIRIQRQLRIGDRLYIQNQNGDVHELRGLVARRVLTEDFIDSGGFAAHPESVTFLGRGKLEDGRDVYRLQVRPPKGEEYTVALDAATSLIDEEAYVDGDGVQVIDYRDYHVIDGVLVPFEQVTSTGDHAFDITTHVKSVVVNKPIEAGVFTPFTPTVIQLSAPVTVPLESYYGLLFAHVKIHDKPFTFLVDSAAQGVVMDERTASALSLVPQGALEVRGAGRTSGRGIVSLDSVQIGAATLPVYVASVVDLSKIVSGPIAIDGILGYPLFAASEVRIDPDKMTMLLAPPGSLQQNGSKIDVDTDRELPEISAEVNQVQARFFVDTGNSGELLLFQSFMNAHPGFMTIAGDRRSLNRGVGGSNATINVMVNELDMASFRLFNRNANIVLARQGAFADRNDGGNIGFGTLRNFVSTFDLSNHALYLDRARTFDDGRGRTLRMNSDMVPAPFDAPTPP